jgi:hypothetical protein
MNKKNFRAHMQQGCVGCHQCEGGIGNIIRGLKVFLLAVCTCGVGLLAKMFFKRCVFCGHSMMFNRHTHGGYDVRNDDGEDW